MPPSIFFLNETRITAMRLPRVFSAFHLIPPITFFFLIFLSHGIKLFSYYLGTENVHILVLLHTQVCIVNPSDEIKRVKWSEEPRGQFQAVCKNRKVSITVKKSRANLAVCPENLYDYDLNRNLVFKTFCFLLLLTSLHFFYFLYFSHFF